MKNKQKHSILTGLKSSKVCLSILSSALIMTSICLPLTMVSCKKSSTTSYVVLTGSPDVTLGENKIDSEGSLSFTITPKAVQKEVVSVIVMKGSVLLTLEECTFEKSTSTVTITKKALNDHTGEIVVTPNLGDKTQKGVQVTEDQYKAALDKISGRKDSINYTIDYTDYDTSITGGEFKVTQFELSTEGYKEKKSAGEKANGYRYGPGDGKVYQYTVNTYGSETIYSWEEQYDADFFIDSLYAITPTELKDSYNDLEFDDDSGTYVGSLPKDATKYDITLSFSDTQTIACYTVSYVTSGSGPVSAIEDVFKYSKIGTTTVTLPSEPELPLPYLTVGLDTRNINTTSKGEDLTFTFKGEEVKDVKVTLSPDDVLTYKDGKLTPKADLTHGKKVAINYSKDGFQTSNPIYCYVGDFDKVDIDDDGNWKQNEKSTAEIIILPPGCYVNEHGVEMEIIPYNIPNDAFCGENLTTVYLPQPIENYGTSTLTIQHGAFGQNVTKIYAHDYKNWHYKDGDDVNEDDVKNPETFANIIKNLQSEEHIYYYK